MLVFLRSVHTSLPAARRAGCRSEAGEARVGPCSPHSTPTVAAGGGAHQLAGSSAHMVDNTHASAGHNKVQYTNSQTRVSLLLLHLSHSHPVCKHFNLICISSPHMARPEFHPMTQCLCRAKPAAAAAAHFKGCCWTDCADIQWPGLAANACLMALHACLCWGQCRTWCSLQQ